MNNIERNSAYPLSLLLSIPKKTCESLAEQIGVTGGTVIRIFNATSQLPEKLICLIKKITKKGLYLIIDDTIIEKLYSKFIGGTSDNYSTITGKRERSLCAVVAMLTDDEVAIPIGHDIWISREFVDGVKRTKSMIAQELIDKIVKLTPISGVLMDGLYTTEDLMAFFIEKKRFDGRYHLSRRVSTEKENAQVKQIKA